MSSDNGLQGCNVSARRREEKKKEERAKKPESHIHQLYGEGKLFKKEKL